MNPRDLVINRVANARKTHDIGRYVKFGSMGIEEVSCKCCGVPIRKLIPDDRFAESRNINGRNVVCERLVLSTLPNYVEVMIYFDDGSKHVTFMCEEDSKKLTNDQLEWLYCADLNEWLHDNSAASDNFWSQQYQRQPIGFKAFPPGTLAA